MSIHGALATHRATPATSPSGDSGDGVVRWALRVLAWTLILGCLAALAVAVVVPRVAGATPYTVLTGSMSPGLPPGTLVVVRPVEPGQIGTGTVVTYQLRSGEPEVVTHRVVAVRSDLTGEVEYQTQGDANPIPDEAWVRPEQIRGALWYAVPQLGRVSNLISGNQREIAVLLVAGALGLYALTMFGSAARDRRRRS